MTLFDELKGDVLSVKNHIKTNKYRYILALCVLLLCVVPLLFSVITTGHDFSYHIGRIRCLADNIQNGKWFSQIYFSGLYDAGYASPAFYGDLFLYIPATAVCLGMKEEPALRLFFMIITAACAISAYWCANKAFKDERAALLASVCYVFSGYFFTDMVIRVALGELQAFVFLPLIIYGFYNIVREDCRYWYVLPLGLAGCIVSHVLTAFVAVILMFVAALFMCVRIFKEKQRLLALIKSVGLFLCVSAFFLFPMLEQLANGEYIATNGISAVRWGTLARRAMPWSSVFSDFCMGTDKINAWIPNGIGLFPVAAAVFFGVSWYKNKRIPRAAAAFLGFGLLMLFAVSDLFPWKTLQSAAGTMQFPWRLMVFATLFFAIFAGLTVKSIQNGKLASVCALVVALCSLFSFFAASGSYYGKMFRNASEEKTVTAGRASVGAGEYLIMNENTYVRNSAGDDATYSELVTGLKSLFSQKTKTAASNTLESSYIKIKRVYGGMEVTFSGNTSAQTYVDLPLINYKGYAAYLDGTVLKTGDGILRGDVKIDGKTYSASYGSALRVYLGNTQSGTVTVRYEGTPVQKISKLVTLFTLLAAAGAFIRKKVRSKSQVRTPAQ